jgi:hypothetical protein
MPPDYWGLNQVAAGSEKAKSPALSPHVLTSQIG